MANDDVQTKSITVSAVPFTVLVIFSVLPNFFPPTDFIVRQCGQMLAAVAPAGHCSDCSHCRIVRNKAAEKAKLGGYGSPASPEAALPHDTHTALARHPAYSINGILGIHQQDANANLQKRKRDGDGESATRCLGDFTLLFILYRRERLPAG